MTEGLAKTALCEWHASHNARLVDFAGWLMPVQYAGIVAEHQATRTAAGLFDVSHMGRFRFEGPDAAAFIDSLTTRRVSDMKVGQIRYSLMCREDGGILDDILVYHLQRSDEPSFFGMVVNAGNREKISAWIQERLGSEHNVAFQDQTLQTAMIAVQGPRAIELAAPLVDCDLANMRYYHGAVATIDDVEGIVSRTGYTGEDGCELMVPANSAVSIWEKLLRAGEAVGAAPVGLGARDTLRLEAAMPLYGHELSEQINPVQACLDFAINLKDREFVGRSAIVKLRDATSQPRRVGLAIEGRRPAREGYPIFAAGKQVGVVTSGTFSPTLEKPIAMGYVEPGAAELGAKLTVDIRGTQSPATVVKLPFYSR